MGTVEWVAVAVAGTAAGLGVGLFWQDVVEWLGEVVDALARAVGLVVLAALVVGAVVGAAVLTR